MISIHALRGEGDRSYIAKRSNSNLFQSTPSVGRATIGILAINFISQLISIHALRGEGDTSYRLIIIN